MKVGEILSSPVHTITPDKSVRYAAELMNELKIGSLVVTEGGETVGIVTSRDLRVTHPNRIVADAMSRDPKSIEPDVYIWNAWDLLNEFGVERLLVCEDGRMVGLVTREQISGKLSELRDPLTGLYRSAYIAAVGEDLLKRRVPFELMFIDLDNFREINKTYGHPVGDDVIVSFANTLKSQIDKSSEYLCRYAGDEFVIITLQGEQRVRGIVRQLRQTVYFCQVEVSATVGKVGPRDAPDFFDLPFRELVTRASLAGTKLKSHADTAKNPPVG